MRRCRHIAVLGLLAVLFLPAPSGAASWGGFSSSREAAEAAKTAEARARSASAGMQNQMKTLNQRRHDAALAAVNRDEVNKIDKDIAETNAKLSKLLAERTSTLKEMVAGLFCSGCGRTRSDILSKGEQFPHPGQHIVAATQAQLDAKVAEFKRREASMRKDIQNLIARRAAAVESTRRKIIAAQLDAQRAAAALTDSRNAWTSAQVQLGQARMAMGILRVQEAQEEAARVAAEQERQWQKQVAWQIAEAEAQQKIQAEEKKLADAQQQAAWAAANAATLQKQNEDSEKMKQAAAALVASTQQNVEKIRVATAAEIARSRRAFAELTGEPITDNPAPANFQQSVPMPSSEGVFRSAEPPAPPRELQQLSGSADNSANSWKDTAAKYYHKGVDYVRDTAKEAVKDKVFDTAKEMVGLKETEPGTPTPSERINDGFKNALKTLTGGEDENGASKNLFQQLKAKVKDKFVDLAADKAEEQVREQVVDRAHDSYFGPSSKTGDAEVDKAQEEFDHAVSPFNLEYETGGRSIPGLKKYFTRVQDKFFNFFDKATKKISDDTSATPEPGNP